MGKFFQQFRVLLGASSLFVALLFGAGPLFAEDSPPSKLVAKDAPASPTSVYYNQFFSEKVLTVSREGDGILPGTLRTALIQASGIRANNSFTMVKIVFDPTVKRVRVTKGPLPEIDGSLTTLDCQNNIGRGVIEGAIEDSEGLDPSEEIAGLKLTSNSNTIHNCHITGFQGPGILVRGNRNVIEFNTVGYHKDSPETAVAPSPVYDEPKTNKGSGILIGAGASDNSIQNNEIIANTFNGVEFAPTVGRGNKVAYNYFAKNSGKPIKVAAANGATRMPQITKISKEGDLYVISGTADPKAEIQIYLQGKDEAEVGMNIVPSAHASTDTFQISTKNKGFVPNQTKLIAITHAPDGNSSEFSNAVVVPGLVPASPVVIGGGPDSSSSSTPAGSDKPATEGEVKEIEINDPQYLDNAEDAYKPKTPSSSTTTSSTPSSGSPAASPTETTLNVKGVGDKGGAPDSGTDKSHDVSALGI